MDTKNIAESFSVTSTRGMQAAVTFVTESLQRWLAQNSCKVVSCQSSSCVVCADDIIYHTYTTTIIGEIQIESF